MKKHQAIIELLKKTETDASIREALQATKTAEDVVQVALNAGVTISVDEVVEFRQHLELLQKQAANDELSEADLEKLAGGIDPFFGLGVLTVGGLLAMGGVGAASGLAVGGVAAGVGGFLAGTLASQR